MIITVTLVQMPFPLKKLEVEVTSLSIIEYFNTYCCISKAYYNAPIWRALHSY